jgi:hypothetical protein
MIRNLDCFTACETFEGGKATYVWAVDGGTLRSTCSLYVLPDPSPPYPKPLEDVDLPVCCSFGSKQSDPYT